MYLLNIDFILVFILGAIIDSCSLLILMASMLVLGSPLKLRWWFDAGAEVCLATRGLRNVSEKHIQWIDSDWMMGSDAFGWKKHFHLFLFHFSHIDVKSIPLIMKNSRRNKHFKRSSKHFDPIIHKLALNAFGMPSVSGSTAALKPASEKEDADIEGPKYKKNALWIKKN